MFISLVILLLYMCYAMYRPNIAVLVVEQGLCGIVVYLYGCVSMVRVFGKGNGRRYFKFALCLALAWVAADMISLTTGLTITFPIILLMIVYRLIQLKIL